MLRGDRLVAFVLVALTPLWMGYPLHSRGEWVPVSFHVAEDSRLYRRLLWGDLFADGTELLFGCFIDLSSIVMGYGGIFDSTYSC